jgi:hypothetical protein
MALILVGAAFALLTYSYPEQLRAPAWVAYVAALAFVFGGVTAIAGQLNSPRLRAWAPVAVLVCLVVPGIWVAFGASIRQCSFNSVYLYGVADGWVCRAAFGIAAVIGLAMVLLAVRHAILSSRGN